MYKSDPNENLECEEAFASVLHPKQLEYIPNRL
jgi:hypothetical protein